MKAQELEQLIATLEARLEDLKARLPAHSTPPAMIAEMDELDDQLEEARSRLTSLKASDLGDRTDGEIN
jgi:chromosome segregation ATPase